MRDAAGSQSRSRSKDRRNEDEDLNIKEIAGGQTSPKVNEEQRVQKIIDKIGSYASFKLNNQKLPEVPESVDQIVVKQDP